MAEMVSHPSHYNKAGRKECIVEMEEKYGGEITAIFCLTNAYKYLYRAGEKITNYMRILIKCLDNGGADNDKIRRVIMVTGKS